MSQPLKLVSKNNFKKINGKQLQNDFEEISQKGDGYILVYRNQKEDAYYVLTNGFTNEEGVYASKLISSSILERGKFFAEK